MSEKDKEQVPSDGKKVRFFSLDSKVILSAIQFWGICFGILSTACTVTWYVVAKDMQHDQKINKLQDDYSDLKDLLESKKELSWENCVELLKQQKELETLYNEKK